QYPAAHLAVRQVEVDHRVDVVALQEELGLPSGTREPVDDEAVVPVVHGQPVADGRLDEVVADQLAGRHDPADLGTQLGVPLHVPAEDVTDADVHQVQVLGEEGGLGTLAAALDPHDHVLTHGGTMTSTPRAVAAGAPRSRGRSAWRRRGWRSWVAASVPGNWPSGPATCWPRRSRRTGRARAAGGWSAGWPRPRARPANPRSAALPR